MTGTTKTILIVVIFGVIAILCVLLALSRADLAISESDNQILRSDNALQGEVIATQAFNFNLFNQVSEHTRQLNSLIDAGTDRTVIEYREILRREKTCDLLVPADVAGGLLNYAYRLRASAMHPDTNRPDETDDRSIPATGLTYCQAVLWIKPLLGELEKGNNQLAGIRKIEQRKK
ncbi:hypothetical protein [Yokenella regensburgei]|uniref:Uncharacterized protein n=1 Tax=Yokenella regensburgei TaxID=158877 RepID=A0AB38FTD2_9ENTR|nr:hypothetical protein [Yokenella regensburgei]SQA62301.1 Uncharacterised protein [Yokenella regensburgei]SQA68146.1 Uncharacterised protein [Yokenella regensburgei]SUQ06460.1 Uncharacterised protein [Yokenella regensburgei]